MIIRDFQDIMIIAGIPNRSVGDRFHASQLSQGNKKLVHVENSAKGFRERQIRPILGLGWPYEPPEPKASELTKLVGDSLGSACASEATARGAEVGDADVEGVSER
jgi:hypothetical protein